MTTTIKTQDREIPITSDEEETARFALRFTLGQTTYLIENYWSKFSDRESRSGYAEDLSRRLRLRKPDS